MEHIEDIARQASKSLEEDGFAIVENIFSPDELSEAKALMGDLFDNFGRFINDKPRNGWMVAADMALATTPGSELLQPEILHPSLLEPKLMETALFRKCAELARRMRFAVSLRFDHAIAKNEHTNTETPWHQDIAYANAAVSLKFLEAGRLHFWVPFQDATVENGCLEYVRGSQKWDRIAHDTVQRRSGHPSYIAEPPADAEKVFGKVPAGGLVLHNIRTLHRAGANLTDEKRVAWVMQFSRFGSVERRLMRLLGKLPDADLLRS